MSRFFDSNSTIDPARDRRQMLLETALVFVVLVLQGGWPVPDVNESVYLPKLKHAWNPAWAPHDFYLNSADAHGIFGQAVGWMTWLLPLPVVAWTGRLLTWGLLAWAWRRLSVAVVPYRWMAVLSAGLFVCLQERTQMAGEWVVGGFEAKGLAYVCVLLGLELVVRNRWNAALVALGAAASFHGLVGGWSLVAAAMAWLCAGPERPRWQSLLPGVAAAFCLALIGVWPAIAMNLGTPSDIVARANQIYVFERLPHHLAPLTFRGERVLTHMLLVGVLAVLWIVAPRGGGLSRLLSFAVAAVVIATIGWVIALATQSRPELGAALLKYYWFRLSDAAAPIGVALGSIAWIAAKGRARPLLAQWRIGVVAGIAGLHLTGYAIDRVQAVRPRADKENKVRDYVGWRHLTDWVRQHTPADAVFLTPRSHQTFVWYTGRSEVVTWKNLPQDAVGIDEWWQRLQDVYFTPAGDTVPESGRRSLTEIPLDRLRQLADQYGFGYVVTDVEPPLPLPLLYRNDSYAVYKMADESQSADE